MNFQYPNPYDSGQPMAPQGQPAYPQGQPVYPQAPVPQGAPQPWAPPQGAAPQPYPQPVYPQGQPVYPQGQPVYTPYAPAYALVPAPDPRSRLGGQAVNRMSLMTLLQFLATLVLETPLIFLATVQGVGLPEDQTAMLLLEAAMVPLSTALPFVIYLLVARQKAAEYLRFEKVGFVTGLLLVLAGLTVVLLGNYPAVLIQNLMSTGGYEPNPVLHQDLATVPDFLLEMGVTAVLVPVMEELAFRGVVFSRLRRHGEGFAIVASALIFSLVHLDASNVVFAFIAGLVFGFVYAKSRNLWLTIFIHALNNGLAVLGENLELIFGQKGAPLADLLMTVLPLALGVVSLILLAIFKRDLLLRRPEVQPWEPAPLNAGESALAVVRAPFFWGLVAAAAVYTVSLFL